LQVGEQAEREYQALWRRLGLSIDWRYTYRTIDENAQRVSQWSFVDLFRKGLLYREEAPVIWCPECHTAIAQADLDDLERQTEFVTLSFTLIDARGDGLRFPVATTRPELLPACVAVFVHPDDAHRHRFVGQRARVPLFDQVVPVLADPAVDREKGTGVVMCCTFGDAADVTWWRTHRLPLVEAIDREGRMTSAAGEYAGLPLREARHKIKADLEGIGLVLDRWEIPQSVRVHERCDTPAEYIVADQWFVRLLDHRETLLNAGEKIRWRPEHMHTRYRAWVENLSWDWCISRQRYFGVPIPVWYCQDCGRTLLPGEGQLPVNPLVGRPPHACECGSPEYIPERDVLDTWFTSSMTPQIAGGWQIHAGERTTTPPDPGRFYQKVYPYSLRPQAHEIIRTWAFYTIAKSLFHFGMLPWEEVFISGWGIAGEGMGKISKSRGGGPLPPLEMIERYSADAARYWSSSTGPGKDAVISEEKIQMGARLVNKLWNVARFSERFLSDPGWRASRFDDLPALSPADRWILSRCQKLISHVTELMESYDYAAAKSEVETFFWREMADNYLEMCKQRLYDSSSPHHAGARFTLYHVLLTLIKLFAPFFPFVTEEIYRELFACLELISAEGEWRFVQGPASIHCSSWPSPDHGLEDRSAEELGEALVQVATTVRRYKSERQVALGSDLDGIQLMTTDKALAGGLVEATSDLMSITRARRIEVMENSDDRAGLQSAHNSPVAVKVLQDF
jgi:valyl-tRNA synthetase